MSMVAKVVLDELVIKGADIICSDKCWESILYLTFDHYTEDVAEENALITGRK